MCTALSVEGHDKQNSSRVLPVRPAAAGTHRRWTSILQSCRSPWRCWSHVWSAGCPWWGAVVRLCALNAGTSRHQQRHCPRSLSRADTGLLPLSCCSDPTVAWPPHQLLPQAQQVQCSWNSRCCCAKARAYGSRTQHTTRIQHRRTYGYLCWRLCAAWTKVCRVGVVVALLHCLADSEVWIES